jgi:hypothetical protein
MKEARKLRKKVISKNMVATVAQMLYSSSQGKIEMLIDFS